METNERASERTKIFVVDDHPMVRELLTDYLKAQPDFDVLGTAEAPAPAIAAMEASPPDVAVVDLTLKKGSGLDLIKDLQRRLPDVLVVVLSMHEELTDMERAFRAGAVGYVMKRESTGQIVDAIRQVRAGRIYANPDSMVQLTTRYLGRPADTGVNPSELLSDREMEVFRLLGAGRSTKDISASLGVGLKTVQTYCGRIKLKLGFKDGSELSRAAYRFQENRY